VRRKDNTDLVADAASRIPVFFIAAVVVAATPANAQQVGPPNPAGICSTAKTAASRLICADPDLFARNAKLAAAYRQKKSQTPLATQKELVNEQLIWIQQRNQKCGLVGKDSASLDELRNAKECIQGEIDARLTQLQDPAQLNPPSSTPTTNASSPTANAVSVAPRVAVAPTFSQNSAASGQDIVVTPVAPTTAQPGTAQMGSNGKLQFLAPASGVSGTAECGKISSSYAPSASAASRLVIEITLKDDTSSFSLFENDTWRSVLDKVRQAVHAKCLYGSISTNSPQISSRLNELYEVTSSRGLFVAHGSALDSAWSVETNLPGTRKKFQSDLGIEKWVKASVLARNPYFFKDMVVGMIVQLDHRISDRVAVFARSDARILVSSVPESFVNQDLVVLAGRVTGNKGVVDPSGIEQLMPAVDYFGTADCAQACEALLSLSAQ
jgi:uncharacterized protein YecT (DUF1311 family)